MRKSWNRVARRSATRKPPAVSLVSGDPPSGAGSDPVASDHRFVPHAVFSHPQVAAFGRTEQELKAAGTAYRAHVQEFGDVAYGWALEDTSGIVKVIVDPETRLLLGAHIMGPQASTLIQPLIQAAHFGQRADDVAKLQYWIHPALSEVIENALLGAVSDE